MKLKTNQNNTTTKHLKINKIMNPRQKQNAFFTKVLIIIYTCMIITILIQKGII
jgi:hypothetical protein